jgi:hypothetical protein
MKFFKVIDCFGEPIGLIGTEKILQYKCKDLENNLYSIIPLH